MIQPTAQKVMRNVKNFPQVRHPLRSVPQMGAGSPRSIDQSIPEKLANIGMSAREFAQSLDVFNDGGKVTEIPFEGDSAG